MWSPIAVIRALSIKTAGSLRVNKLNEYLLESVIYCIDDSDEYVLKNCIICL